MAGAGWLKGIALVCSCDRAKGGGPQSPASTLKALINAISIKVALTILRLPKVRSMKFRNWVVNYFQLFSVRPLRPLCLYGEFTIQNTHHKGTEDTKVAQRISKKGHYPNLVQMPIAAPAKPGDKLPDSAFRSSWPF
jgi:hypothetical protein